MFNHKAHISIILVTSHQVIRNDFARDQREPLYQLQADLDPESGLQQAIELVVHGQRRLAPQALVLSSEIWSQTILLPSRSVQGITQEELAEALKFESETLSGFEIDNLSLAFVPMGVSGENHEYWVSAIQTSELDEVHRLIEQSGSRTIAFAHPAGLTNLLDADSSSRIETWSGLSFLFNPQQTTPAKIIQSGISLESDIEKHWPELAIDDIVVLAGPGVQPGQATLPANTTSLSNEADLRIWFASIAEIKLPSLASRIPTLYIGKKKSASAPRHLVAAMLAVIVIGGCFWHHQELKQQQAELAHQIELIQEPGRLQKEYDSQLVTIRETRTKLDSEAVATSDNLKRVQFFIDQQRDRFTKLLNLLVALRKDELVVNRIGGSLEGVVISGISLNGESAQAFAKRLREIAIEVGWVVNPAKQEGQQKLTSGGPWTFDILLSDAGPLEINRTASREKIQNQNQN